MKDLAEEIEKTITKNPVNKDNFLMYWKACRRIRKAVRMIEADIEKILLRAKLCE